MDRADIALVISLISAAFTGGGLVWQMTLYRLSGARLNVTLTPCLIDPLETVSSGPNKGWGKELPSVIAPMLARQVELAQVRVTNIGRTAVSIEDIALDFGRTRPFSLGRMTIAPYPAKVQGSSTERAHRLDPGQGVVVYFELWSPVKAMRERKSGTLSVRATARAVGRRQRRSRWRNRWRISPEMSSLLPGRQASSLDLAYRVLWRGLQHSEKKYSTSMAWYSIEDALKRGEPKSIVREKLADALDESHRHTASLVWEAYELAEGRDPWRSDDEAH